MGPLNVRTEPLAFRRIPLILILAATLALGLAGDGFARVGGGFSFGGRGALTFSAPTAACTALFPMNQHAEELPMGAPSTVTPKPLRELHLRLNLPESKSLK
jgi:hypothetical protein